MFPELFTRRVKGERVVETAFIVAFMLSASSTEADGQQPLLANPPQATAVIAPAAPACSPACVPALTPVELMLDADLGSKISITGATFPLHLNKPIIIDGRELVSAGAQGEGEIIHAKKASGMGAAGELVLAARFVKVDGQPLKLRSLRLAVTGKDATKSVVAFSAASAASPVPVGVIGFFIAGQNVVVPKGTIALAKTAADFQIVAASDAPPKKLTNEGE